VAAFLASQLTSLLVEIPNTKAPGARYNSLLLAKRPAKLKGYFPL